MLIYAMFLKKTSQWVANEKENLVFTAQTFWLSVSYDYIKTGYALYPLKS